VVGLNHEVIEQGAIVVSGASIAWSGRRAELPARYADVPAIDLAGMTLLPGLVEAHSHLALDGGADPMSAVRAASPGEVVQQVLGSARTLARSGVTLVRDLGAPDFLDVRARELLRREPLPGPRLLLSTRPLTRPGSHCWFLGGACASPAELRSKVAENHEHGADWIKIMVTGGFTSGSGSPYESQFSSEDLRTVVHHAHRRSLRVAAHAHGTHGIRAAVQAGVDTVEHCTWFVPNGFDADEDVMAALARSGSPVCPTVNSRARLATGALPWAARLQHLERMRAAGVRLVVGTDSGIGNNPHDAYAAALDCYRDLGLTPLDVLELATYRSAQVVAPHLRVGAVAAGMAADVIAVPGDPVADLQVLQDVRFVMIGGVVVRDDRSPSRPTQGASR
jgi:imidazolonepropionase-like amidohydrolase